MGDESLSATEVAGKLVTYRKQFEQVEELLMTDPSNETYLKLKSDLEEVICLTEDLAKIKRVDENEGMNVGNEDLSTPQFQVGDHCEVRVNEVWFPAWIDTILPDQIYTVSYFGHAGSETVDHTYLRQIEPAGGVAAGSGAQLKCDEAVVGLTCMAKFTQDGKWYPARLEEAADNGGFKVLFMQYGNHEVVPLEYLRTTASKAPQDAKDGLISIPENLRILPSDTEEQKAKKKKRIKAIKNKNRFTQMDTAQKEKQSGWQTFLNKGKTKVKGTVSARKRGTPSMFQSPDEVDGKVGVVGSGKGMTGFEQRKKFKLNL